VLLAMLQRRLLVILGLAGAAMTPAFAQTPPPAVYAAGSLREALTGIASALEARTGTRVALTFGASGLLRERIEKGEAAQVFASADTEHPQRLANAGDWQAPVVFVRNRLCALAAPTLPLTPDTLLDTLLRPEVRLATSTPKADPSGDYAWELFRRAGLVRSGSFAVLSGKALQLTGASDSPKPPAGRNAYAWNMDEGKADVFLTYCTNAIAAKRELPALQVVDIPAELQVSAAYALTVRRGAPAAAADFARALLAPEAQAQFQRLGFSAP
jgi:molybdate transport system substrate-binding protein